MEAILYIPLKRTVWQSQMFTIRRSWDHCWMVILKRSLEHVDPLCSYLQKYAQKVIFTVAFICRCVRSKRRYLLYRYLQNCTLFFFNNVLSLNVLARWYYRKRIVSVIALICRIVRSKVIFVVAGIFFSFLFLRNVRWKI